MVQLDIKLIEQLREEGKLAALDRLPFSANPHPFHSAHAVHWERGYMAAMLKRA